MRRWLCERAAVWLPVLLPFGCALFVILFAASQARRHDLDGLSMLLGFALGAAAMAMPALAAMELLPTRRRAASGRDCPPRATPPEGA